MIIGQMKNAIKTYLKVVFGKGTIKSYAQNGEDVLLRTVIGNKKKGIYVEVGAFHPIQYSNTYLFYRHGWSGLVIDANADSRTLFKIFRPKDIFVQEAISSKEEKLKYYCFHDPAYNTLSEEQASLWIKKGIQLKDTITLTCVSLKSILKKHNIENINLLSVDAEGLDFEVLQSHDWAIPTAVIVVESHDFDLGKPMEDKIYAFLIKKGYILTAYAGFSLIFKKSD